MPSAVLSLGLLAVSCLGRDARASVAQAAFARVEPDGALFNRATMPVSERDAALLSSGGYRFDAQGRLYSPDGSTLPQSEFPFALEDARSRARLKALLEINLILSRNNFAKKLPPEDLAALRKVGGENWDLLSKSTRKDLRRCFSDSEIVRLNEKFSKSSASVPPPYAVQEPWDPGAAAPRGLDSAGKEPFWSGIPLVSMPEALVPLALSRPPEAAAMLHASPAAPPRKARPNSRSVAALPAPWEPPAAPAADERVAALPAPWAAGERRFVAEPAPAPPVPAVQGLDESFARIKSTVSAPKLPAPAPAPPGAGRPAGFSAPSILSVPGQPLASYPEFSPEAFRAFLESAPYGRDVKPILQLLADNARDPERRIALGMLQLQYPHIILDSQKSRTKSASITRLAEEGRPEGRLQLALSDGPVLSRIRRLFGKRAFLLPDSPDFYRERALPAPALQALSRESPSDGEKADAWGAVRTYRDGSLRLRLTPEQLAGSLLKELLLLDSALRGWDADPYHAELRAEAAQFGFYRDLAAKTGKEPALDLDLAGRYKAWLERPEEYVDFVLQAMSAPRGGLFDPRGPSATARQEVEVLLEAEALDADTARRTLESLPAAPSDADVLPAWLKAVAGGPAQGAWLSLERQARRKP